MPEWQWIANFGFAAVVLFFVGKWLANTADKLIDRLIPLGERYVISTEALHDTLKENMETQQTLCDTHGTLVKSTADAVDKHDDSFRSAVRSACQMCRTVSAKEFPGSAAEVDKHCREIERIIGEA